MKVRLPQQNNRQDMMKQVQKLQEDMQSTQAELDAREYTVSSGGGIVTVVVTGKKEVKSIKINPEAVDPSDVEMLEDLLVAALNEAAALADKTNEEEMGKLTGGLNIPGLGF